VNRQILVNAPNIKIPSTIGKLLGMDKQKTDRHGEANKNILVF
jgi:hypothetical protein